MTIPFEVPAQFMAKVLSGEYVRYGGILKDSVTGQVVGHLKEAGSLGKVLSAIPMNPISAISDVIQISQYAHLSHQNTQIMQNITQIQSTLERLQLITSVGALASVASLGVSVAGFAFVRKRLKMLESKLDDVLGELSQVKKMVQRGEAKIDALGYSRFKAAAEELSIAEDATIENERIEYSRTAEAKFREMKHYYSLLLNNEEYNALNDPELSLPQALELHSRFIASMKGELQACFLRNDLGAYRKCLQNNIGLAQKICHFDITAAFRSRSDGRIFIDSDEMPKIKEIHDIASENFARIRSMSTEVNFIRRNNLTPIQYLKELKECAPDILLLPSA
nr:hypothetical protein [Nitrosomonas nitrosa]